MVKRFYKITKRAKVFFRPGIQTRTVAYGDAIKMQAREWQAYFQEEWRQSKGRFVLSRQGNSQGDDRTIGGPLYESDGIERRTGLAELSLNGVDFTLAPDGFVLMNGKLSPLCVGSEIKAWAFMSLPTRSASATFLVVVGKPLGWPTMQLTVYETVGLRPTGTKLATVELPHTMNLDSELICFGRHVFLNHNSTLSYYYFNVEASALEEVAIGTDGPNGEKSWCTDVSGNIVMDRSGRVFWRSGNDVYGIVLGAPRTLLHVELLPREILLGIRTGADSLYLYVEDKNSHNRTSIRCRTKEDGSYGRISQQ